MEGEIMGNKSATLRHDDRYTWKGFGKPSDFGNLRSWDSFCRLRIYDMGIGLSLIILSANLAEDTGTTITNCAENILPLIARQFQIENPQSAVWVDDSGTLSQIFCRWIYDDRKKTFAASNPYWKHLGKDELERMLGQSLELETEGV
jgi:hypothetical protein